MRPSRASSVAGACTAGVSTRSNLPNAQDAARTARAARWPETRAPWIDAVSRWSPQTNNP
jgi:hypothetical protein